MEIIIGILTAALILCAGVIYDQHRTITIQRKRLIEALDWVEPAELVIPEDWHG